MVHELHVVLSKCKCFFYLNCYNCLLLEHFANVILSSTVKMMISKSAVFLWEKNNTHEKIYVKNETRDRIKDKNGTREIVST